MESYSKSEKTNKEECLKKQQQYILPLDKNNKNQSWTRVKYEEKHKMKFNGICGCWIFIFTSRWMIILTADYVEQ